MRSWIFFKYRNSHPPITFNLYSPPEEEVLEPKKSSSWILDKQKQDISAPRTSPSDTTVFMVTMMRMIRIIYTMNLFHWRILWSQIGEDIKHDMVI